MTAMAGAETTEGGAKIFGAYRGSRPCCPAQASNERTALKIDYLSADYTVTLSAT